MNASSTLSSPRKRITVIEGEAHTSGDPKHELSTVLGSCVAACLYDPVHRIGGMNHFLLAQPGTTSGQHGADTHYGLYLMEVLINQMMQAGADRRQLRAHLYGGASMREGLGDIGRSNARFAQDFLKTEGIPLVRSDLGGTCARRIGFRPYSGQVRVTVADSAQVPAPRPARPRVDAGDIEFF